MEELAGHGEGSVNSVAWNPRNERMFASCSDDHTVRIWEAPMPITGSDGARHGAEGLGLGLGLGSGLVGMSNGKGKGKGVLRQRWDGVGPGGSGEEATVAGEPSGSGPSSGSGDLSAR